MVASTVYERKLGVGEAFLLSINGQCHFERSIPPLLTKPLAVIDVIYPTLDNMSKIFYVSQKCQRPFTKGTTASPTSTSCITSLVMD